jgi:hypothetical protein
MECVFVLHFQGFLIIPVDLRKWRGKRCTEPAHGSTSPAFQHCSLQEYPEVKYRQLLVAGIVAVALPIKVAALELCELANSHIGCRSGDAWDAYGWVWIAFEKQNCQDFNSATRGNTWLIFGISGDPRTWGLALRARF